MIGRAFLIEWLTVCWMVLEITVALWAGISARSLPLIAFGADSLIQLLSASVLIWRLTVEIKRGATFSERTEQAASRIGGGLLFALSIYVVVSAGWNLWTRQGGDFSLTGFAVTVLAIPIMNMLAKQKLHLADALGSRALRADAIESVTCLYLAYVVIGALLAQYLLESFHVDGWWIGSVASLGIVWLLVKEGREAWATENDCDEE